MKQIYFEIRIYIKQKKNKQSKAFSHETKQNKITNCIFYCLVMTF